MRARVTEIGRALRDYHATKPARKRNLDPLKGHQSEAEHQITASEDPQMPIIGAGRHLTHGVFAVGSSERLSITLSTMPKSRAISAVRNLSRSRASSIAL